MSDRYKVTRVQNSGGSRPLAKGGGGGGGGGGLDLLALLAFLPFVISSFLSKIRGAGPPVSLP